MKILVVVPDLIVGGVTTVVTSLIKNVKGRDVEFKLVTLFDNGSCDLPDIHQVTLGMKTIFDIPFSVLKMKKIIEDYNPDIVHTHTMYSHLIVYACAYLKKTYKIISSEHGTYTSNLRFYKRMNLFRLMNPVADLITNVSDASCESYVRQNIVDKFKIRTMYNGIDIKKFKFSNEARVRLRKKLDLDDEGKVIGFVGRLSEEKNLPNLINAIELLDINFKLVIIGAGPETEKIIQLINNKGLNNKVVMLGEIKDPSEYYSVFDLLVLSSDTEGLPTVILEAIASSCSVVTTNCGGVKETFPKDYSFIVPVGEYLELSHAILNNLELAADSRFILADKCRRKLINNFSVDSMCQKWRGVYSEIYHK